MNENRRLHYLEAMGIDSFVPRRLLINAAAARLCELAAAEPAASEGSTAVHTASGLTSAEFESAGHTGASQASPLSSASTRSDMAGASVLSDKHFESAAINKTIGSVLEGLSGSSKKPSSASVSKPTVAPSADDESHAGLNTPETIERLASTKARFQLGMWLTDTSIQVLDSRHADDALPTHALLSNFLVACNLIHTNLSAMETQVWPLPGTAESEQGWDAACSMMEDFLQFRFEAKNTRALLLCGQDAVKAALGESIDYASMVFKYDASSRYGLPIVVLPALREFLYEPALKSSVWGVLAQLRNALH